MPINDIPADDGEWHRLTIEVSGYTHWPIALHLNTGAQVRATTESFDMVEAFVGDSYGESINNVPGDLQGMMRNPKGLAPEQARLLGIKDLRNLSIGARGWVADVGGTRPTTVETIDTDLIPMTEVLGAVLMASPNDAGYDVEPAYREGLPNLLTNRPDMQLTFVSNMAPVIGGPDEAALTELRDVARMVCADLGVPFIDMTGFFTGEDDPHFAGEGHPTQSGYQAAGVVIKCPACNHPIDLHVTIGTTGFSRCRCRGRRARCCRGTAPGGGATDRFQPIGSADPRRVERCRLATSSTPSRWRPRT